MSQKRDASRSFPKALWGVALLMSAGVCVFALFDPATIPAWYRLHATAMQLHEQVEVLQQQVRELQRELALMAQQGQSDESADYFLQLAQDELGFVAENECVFFLSPPKEPNAITRHKIGIECI